MMWKFLPSAFAGLMISSSMSNVGATSKSISFDEPFQDAFKNLPHSPCVTLYHRNGRVGCGTIDRDVQEAPLLYYDGSSQLSADAKFVAVIEEFALTAETIAALLKANTYGNLKGVLVLNVTDSENDGDYISHASKYPNGYGTPSANLGYGNVQFPWNANGDGLNEYDLYGVPMAFINQYETSMAILKVAQDESKAPDIVAQFNYYMGPNNIDSAQCLAWEDEADGKWNPKCLPLGGTSVWGHAGSPPQNGNQNANADGRPSVIIGASIDSTSLFHDLAPGANTAASNILSLLMAAYLVGQYTDDATLDALPNRILFGFFQGESYGYMGSRKFINDVLNFECNEEVSAVSQDDNSDKACLYPLSHSLKFQDIGSIAGMLTVDQVGYPLTNGNLYVHNEGNDGTFGSFIANVLKSSYTNAYTPVASAATDNGNGYPYPPTPLTSLLSLTGGAIDGAALTGYDYVFAKRPPYQSHLNSVDNIHMNFKSVAASATILARSALAAAYDDGSYDSDTSSAYAANLIPELSYDDALLVQLANCFFEDGNCETIRKYSVMEANAEKSRTGFNIGSGESLGTPPNYYVGIHSINYGQPFAQVGDQIYGNYNKGNYGNKKTDAVGIQPRMLELALRNMLHDFLGQGAFVDADGNEVEAKSCNKASDCDGVEYCSSYGDSVTCTGSNICACTRAHFHTALDESIVPSLNKEPGFFEIDENDTGNTPLYTEPYWSSDVGVSLYRYSKRTPGFLTLGLGLVVGVVCFFSIVVVKVSMKKQKLY